MQCLLMAKGMSILQSEFHIFVLQRCPGVHIIFYRFTKTSRGTETHKNPTVIIWSCFSMKIRMMKMTCVIGSVADIIWRWSICLSGGLSSLSGIFLNILLYVDLAKSLGKTVRLDRETLSFINGSIICNIEHFTVYLILLPYLDLICSPWWAITIPLQKNYLLVNNEGLLVNTLTSLINLNFSQVHIDIFRFHCR